MWLWLLVSCIPATTYGLRTDGMLPPEAGAELVLAGGASNNMDPAVWGVGATGVLGLHDRFSVGFSGARVDREAGFSMDGRYRLLDERDDFANVTLLGGGGVLGQVPGVYGGFVLSAPADGELRPYTGLLLNPVFPQGSRPFTYGTLSIGASYRPRIGPRTGLVLGGEGFVLSNVGGLELAGMGWVGTAGIAFR